MAAVWHRWQVSCDELDTEGRPFSTTVLTVKKDENEARKNTGWGPRAMRSDVCVVYRGEWEQSK